MSGKDRSLQSSVDAGQSINGMVKNEERFHMTNDQHELLMREFDKIAEKVNSIAPEARDSAFNVLSSTLLNGTAQVAHQQKQSVQIEHTAQAVSASASNGQQDRDYIAEIKHDVEKFNLKSAGAKHCAKYGVYYWTRVAPEDQRLESVTPEDLRRLWSIAGLKPPAKSDYGTPLRNAKADGHLESPTQGHYVMTDEGAYFVKNELLKEQDK